MEEDKDLGVSFCEFTRMVTMYWQNNYTNPIGFLIYYQTYEKEFDGYWGVSLFSDYPKLSSGSKKIRTKKEAALELLKLNVARSLSQSV